MITLEEFIKYLTDIEELEEKNDKLTKLLVCKNTTGWISVGTELIDDLIQLIYKSMNLENDDTLEWYLYECMNDNKFCYDTWNGAKYKFDLRDKKDLYNFMLHNYSEIQNKEVCTEDELLEVKVNEENLNYLKEIIGLKDE